MKQKTNSASSIFANVTMIVRTAGERTIDLSKKLIEEQGYADNIFLTQEVPFSEAIRKAFEIGISEGKPWTFCVDADVLLRANSIHTLLTFAEEQKPNVFEVQGMVYDKFFPWPRQAGNHLYRTSLLESAIKLIPKEGVDIRPESYVIRMMREQGYPSETLPLIVGLHDYQQYYFDVFRKSFVQAHKHLNYADDFIPYWKEMADQDKDYEVALAAFSEGIRNTQKVYIDKNQKIYKDKFLQLSFSEKKSMNLDSYDLPYVESILKNSLKTDYTSLSTEGYSKKLNKKLTNKFREHGFLKSLGLIVGLAFIKFGNKIKNSIDPDRD